MKLIIGCGVVAALLATVVTAQDGARAVTSGEAPAALVEKPIGEDARRALLSLQQREAGLADAMGVIQKERDAIAAEWNRAIARLQAAAPEGMELSPQLTYVRKPAPVKAPGKESPQ